MDLSEMQTRAAELELQISALPAGSVTKKTVNGKEYFYHRWTENKKRREKYISADELENFRAQIERRKELEPGTESAEKAATQGKICGCLRVYHQCPHRRGAAFLCGICSQLSQARVLPAAARLCLRRAAGQGVHSLRPAPDGENHHDPPDFRGDERHGAYQGSVHSDHRKRHAGRREPRPQGIGSAGLSLCVPRRSDADGGFYRGRGAVF